MTITPKPQRTLKCDIFLLYAALFPAYDAQCKKLFSIILLL